jgi:hypothetical protein
VADAPEVAQAKEKLRGLVVTAVDRLEDLMDSDHDGIRLGAAKEVLDRGGVPVRHGLDVQVEIGLDDEIEQLMSDVRRQVEGKKTAQEYLADGIEDAVVIEDDRELEVGEQAGKLIGVPVDDVVADAETEDHAAWWQAAPPPSDEV